MAGYSGTPLAQKLGIKPGALVVVLGAPAGFIDSLAPLPDGVTITTRVRDGADVIVAFFTKVAELKKRFPALHKAMAVDGGLWIGRPKQSSGIPTDITEHVPRQLLLPTGLVDNKVCAIDDTWSGLRFVIRKELRAARR